MTKVAAVIEQLETIILGKPHQIKLAVACLLARGHLLIEDLPGMGKTTLAEALARVLGLSYQRIQFTSDMLPADIVGVSIFDPKTQEFQFRKGPVFSQILLADEINRTTPKTQSALLEAMEEKQVTVDGNTYRLPNPFFVIATQNPTHQMGTFPLPESQLDRFLMRIQLGYPTPEAERELLQGGDRRVYLKALNCLLADNELQKWQDSVDAIYASDAVIAYIQRLLTKSRQLPNLAHGISPRAGLALLRAAKAWAFIQERNFIQPDDVQIVFSQVVEHRLRGEMSDALATNTIAEQILQSVDVVV